MPDYRLYFHNSQGHFGQRKDLDSADDEVALKVASEARHPFPVEIWCGNRKVGLIMKPEPHDIEAR